MTLLLKQIYNLFKMLNSETGTNQIAAGLACGLILGFSPILSLQALIVFVCAFVFRIQLGAAFLAAFFFKFIAYLFDPFFHMLGSWILELESLKPLFTTLYNMPIIPFTRFNNSIVMGSGVAAIILAPVLFFVFRKLIEQYRVQILARFQQSKMWKALKATPLVQWYLKYQELYG